MSESTVQSSSRLAALFERLKGENRAALMPYITGGDPDPKGSLAVMHALVEGGVEDVIYTRGVNGLPASWLKASLRSIGLDPDNLPIPEGRSTAHLPEGKTPWRDIWSGGQGTGLIRDVPGVAELVTRLQREYIAACAIPDMAGAASAALAAGQEA